MADIVPALNLPQPRRHLARENQCTLVILLPCISFLIIHHRYIDDAAEDDEEEDEEDEEDDEVNEGDLIDNDDGSEAEEQEVIDSEEERKILKTIAKYVHLPCHSCNIFSLAYDQGEGTDAQAWGCCKVEERKG